MKNLTVKKVALGLFLAGYAASSAFAITASTQNYIQGNLPVFKSNEQGAAEHTMTFKIMDQDKPTDQIGSRPAKVKDIIRIEFNLEDADKDKLSADRIKETFKIFIKKNKNDSTEAWKEVDHADLTDLKVELNNDTDKDKAVISFVISDKFAGAEHIGYQLLERTEFGAPYANKWLLVTDVWSQANPNAKDPSDKLNPTTPPTDPDTGDYGPGDSTNNGSGPIESTKTRIGIFKITGAAVDVNSIDYSREDKIPAYGDKFAAVVWMEDIENDKLDANEVTKTGSYTFTWSLTGDYDYKTLNNLDKDKLSAKKDQNDKYEALTQNVSNGTGDLDKGTNNVIILGSTAPDVTKHNEVYDTNYYPAGAQGYKLTVTTN